MGVHNLASIQYGVGLGLQHIDIHGNTLQRNATQYNTLQYTATHYNTLQHTATGGAHNLAPTQYGVGLGLQHIDIHSFLILLRTSGGS